MLNNNHFYHRIIRKMVIGFGTMFNNIRLVRYNKAGTIEIERVIVPLSYANKEKFYKRITQDPELTKETGVTLPRMGFSLDSISYDPLRKKSLYNNQFQNSGTSKIKSIHGTPYNFDFTLSIYVRNVEDGTQIVEQILPYFNPDYTLNMQLTSLTEVKTDVPIVLNSITQNTDSDGAPDNVRIITWDLNFTMKGYLYGPILQQGLITKSTANVSTQYLGVGQRTVKMVNGTGDFKIGELVYEGLKLSSANSVGYVESWSDQKQTLVLSDISGVLKPGFRLKGAVTRADWLMSTDPFDTTDVNIQVTPNPATANVDDDFGYTTNINENNFS